MQIYSAYPVGRLGSPRTIRKVLGGSLHTFSPERKYDLLRHFREMLVRQDNPSVKNQKIFDRSCRTCAPFVRYADISPR